MPMTAKDLDSAEIVFMTAGLTAKRSAALKAELKRNKTVIVETTVDEAIAARFRYKF